MSDFSIGPIGTNSTGPMPPAVMASGDGTGFTDGAVNGGHSNGPISPSPAYAGGSSSYAQIQTCGWQGYSGGQFVVCVYGSHPQNYFTSVALLSPANLSFMSASATYSNTVLPGYTYWYWAEPTGEYAFIGQSIPVVFSGLTPPLPTPGGQGDISDPYTWQSVVTKNLPPKEYQP